jgi:hypothetical protein
MFYDEVDETELNLVKLSRHKHVLTFTR